MVGYLALKQPVILWLQFFANAKVSKMLVGATSFRQWLLILPLSFSSSKKYSVSAQWLGASVGQAGGQCQAGGTTRQEGGKVWVGTHMGIACT